MKEKIRGSQKIHIDHCFFLFLPSILNQQNTKAANPRLNKRRGEKFPGFFFIFLIDIIVARRQSHGRIVEADPWEA
jgi:hypothetical protein